MLKDAALPYYLEQNCNCAETLIHAGNEYYGLELSEKEMKLVGVYGGGIQCGSVCGALLSAAALLSLRYVETRAHDSADIKPITQMLMKRFEEKMGSTLCAEVKPKFFVPGARCQSVVEAACDTLESVIAEYEAAKK